MSDTWPIEIVNTCLLSVQDTGLKLTQVKYGATGVKNRLNYVSMDRINDRKSESPNIAKIDRLCCTI